MLEWSLLANSSYLYVSYISILKIVFSSFSVAIIKYLVHKEKRFIYGRFCVCTVGKILWLSLVMTEVR